MDIRRDFYLNKLIKRKNNGLIKAITGIRRCRKSYLLNNLFYHHLLESGIDTDHIIRFAFDSADDLYLIGESLIQIEKEKRGVDPEKFITYIRSKVIDNGMYYLLLDEVQMLDCFVSVLNGYLRKENMDVFVTGSNAKFLSKDVATEFAGRGDEVHMYPLSFAEFMTVYPGGINIWGYLSICYMVESCWLFYAKIQRIKQSLYKICLMKFILEILPLETG